MSVVYSSDSAKLSNCQRRSVIVWARAYILKHLWEGTSTAITVSEDEKGGIVRFKILSWLSNRNHW